MSNEQQGPLHLQRNLAVCTESLEKMLRATVDHRLTSVYSLYCRCGASGKFPLSRKSFEVPGSPNSIAARTAEGRKHNIQTASELPLPVTNDPGAPARFGVSADDERRGTCRFFAIKLNDEEAVIHAFCRRCENRILIYDRVLY